MDVILFEAPEQRRGKAAFGGRLNRRVEIFGGRHRHRSMHDLAVSPRGPRRFKEQHPIDEAVGPKKEFTLKAAPVQVNHLTRDVPTWLCHRTPPKGGVDGPRICYRRCGTFFASPTETQVPLQGLIYDRIGDELRRAGLVLGVEIYRADADEPFVELQASEIHTVEPLHFEF